MDQTALRPKSRPGMPGGRGVPGMRGRDPGDGPGRAPKPPRRPHAARRRGRRLIATLFGLFCALLLVLAGVGLGTVGATVIGMSRLAEMQQQAATARPPAKPSAPPAASATAPTPSPAAVRAGLGVEVVDAPEGPGALVVAVHVPGPGYTAGLVRGDVLLRLGTARVGSATDLAAIVGDVRPGHQLVMTVRHDSGAEQKLAVMPGVLT